MTQSRDIAASAGRKSHLFHSALLRFLNRLCLAVCLASWLWSRLAVAMSMSLSLEWDANPANESVTHYVVYVADDPLAFTATDATVSTPEVVAVVQPPDSTNPTVLSPTFMLDGDTVRYLSVTAVNGYGESAYAEPLPVDLRSWRALNPAWQPGQRMPHRFVAYDAKDPAQGGEWLPDYALAAGMRISRSGRWSEIFPNASVVANQVVLIPPGVEVIYDVPSNERMKALVVQGKFEMDRLATTSLSVGTVCVEPTGSFRIAPSSENAKSVVRFSGVSDVVEDPGQSGIGLLSMGGAVNVEGWPRQPAWSFTMSVAPGARSTTVSHGSGWALEDILVFADEQLGADPTKWSFATSYASQTERVKVTSVSGNQLAFEPALKFAHGVSGAGVVGLLSRNVAFISDLGSAGARAHMRFLGGSQVSIRHAMFVDMGRSLVAEWDDTVFGTSGEVSKVGTNQSGRHVLNAFRLTSPVVFEGNAILGRTTNGAERFGVVLHRSSGLIRSNVIVGAKGAGIVLEDGVETGQVQGNLVIGTGGGTGLPDDERFARSAGKDLGAGGVAVWSRSPLVLIQGNFAAGYFSRAGFSYYTHPSFASGIVPSQGTPSSLAGQQIVISQIPLQQHGGFWNNRVYGLMPLGMELAYSVPSESNRLIDFGVTFLGTYGVGLSVVHGGGVKLENPRFQGGWGGWGVVSPSGGSSMLEIVGGQFRRWGGAVLTFPLKTWITDVRFQDNQANIYVRDGSEDVWVRNYNLSGIDYWLYAPGTEGVEGAVAVPGVVGSGSVTE